MEYLLSEYKDKMMDRSLAIAVNAFRIRTRRLKPRSARYQTNDEESVTDEELTKSLTHDVAALAKFIGMIYGSPVPE